MSLPALLQVHDLVKEAISKGAKATTGSGIPNLGGAYDSGYFMQPTVLDNASMDMKVYKEEIFGPAMPIITFKQDRDAIKMANDTEYGLAAYFWTKVSLPADLSSLWFLGQVYLESVKGGGRSIQSA